MLKLTVHRLGTGPCALTGKESDGLTQESRWGSVFHDHRFRGDLHHCVVFLDLGAAQALLLLDEVAEPMSGDRIQAGRNGRSGS